MLPSSTPPGAATCTKMTQCQKTVPTLESASAPAQTATLTGTPDSTKGSIVVTVETQALPCPGVAVSTALNVKDTGFSPKVVLTGTMRVFAVGTSSPGVCYSSTVPFLSQSWPTNPQAGTALLLPCSYVAKKPPCQLPSIQTKTAIIVKFLFPGGDPTFSVVIPTGRLVWPSTFPNGKVGTAYASHFQSKGGKAPFRWKVVSGSLAPGLTLNAATGAVTGTPTTKGTFSGVVRASDAESPPKNADISVSVKIA